VLGTREKSALIGRFSLIHNIKLAMTSAKIEGDDLKEKVSNARIELEETSNRAKEYERGA
jgi:hypothetical protein